MPQPHSLTSLEGGVEPLEQPSTTDHVEVPQPQVAASADGEAQQPLGPEPAESTIVEDGQSGGTSLNAPISSMPAPSVPTTSTRCAEEEVIPVTGPSTQL